MSARDALSNALWDNYTQAQKNAFIDAYRDEVALEIGRDALRDGLVPTLVRLVGEANTAKLMADFRDAHAHELAEQIRAEYGNDGSDGDQWRTPLNAADHIDPKAKRT